MLSKGNILTYFYSPSLFTLMVRKLNHRFKHFLTMNIVVRRATMA
ncbi:Uncharacterised protein [Klebsiella variicola]|nr:Uncharacterised protein [Klebsiella variicola]SLW80814.1 Uncharacterised protein [Klebsiella variicola]SLY50816.1 Uncharacterised protein [Klebsiella variicola]SMA28577.1 Uncharacterised protein [Klebsiella variicola]SMA28753.1 Uncharacterised protein [Klebsiella variicola]